MTFDVVVGNGQLVLPQGVVMPGDVGIRDSKIATLARPGSLRATDAQRYIDAHGAFVLPGAIDPHVHIGYKGHVGMPLEELPRQFASESRDAVLGGVTAMMITYRSGDPYSKIFEDMRIAGERYSLIDFGYNLGITNMGHVDELEAYRERFGVSSFKFYMAYRGADGTASGNTYNEFTDGLFLRALSKISKLDGGLAMVHAENPDIIAMERDRLETLGSDGLAAWTESRPDIAEAEAISRAIFLAGSEKCPLYIPHVSSAAGLRAALAKQGAETSVTLETCPHYLTHTAAAQTDNLAKVNPPLREQSDITTLWEAIREGHIQTIGTDHCATRVSDKEGSVWDAVPGFPGLSTMTPVILSGVIAGKLPVTRAAQVLAENTARTFGLYPAKGAIMVGADADLMVVDPAKRKTVDHRYLGSDSDFSIYDGQELNGWPDFTIAGGRVLADQGTVVETVSRGSYLFR